MRSAEDDSTVNNVMASDVSWQGITYLVRNGAVFTIVKYRENQNLKFSVYEVKLKVLYENCFNQLYRLLK